MLKCNECGDIVYCPVCDVKLKCICVQRMCGRFKWIEKKMLFNGFVSMTNDYPNCWCTDCHYVCCWNLLSFCLWS